MLEYIIPEFRGVKVQQKNIWACLAKDGCWLDVHLSKTLRNLRLAFQYKRNSLPGESVPDPREDSSFRKLLDDPAFSEKVDSLLK